MINIIPSLTNQQLALFLTALGSDPSQDLASMSLADVKKNILCWKSANNVRWEYFWFCRLSPLLSQGGSLAEFVSVLVRSEMKNIAEEICNNINNSQLSRASSMKAY